MLDASRQAILERLGDRDLVLDVGGWARPFARADWVIDLLPHETRGLYGYDQGGAADERFSAASWVQRDLCEREPWPFADGQFDFAICSHTLEDIRDPIWACAELQRVARAGYIEVPSLTEELSFGVQGPWTGWGHHHWLVEVEPGLMRFVFKHHIVHGREDLRFPAGFHETLAPAERVSTLWWEDGFAAMERVFIGPGELDAWLAAVVSAPARGPR